MRESAATQASIPSVALLPLWLPNNRAHVKSGRVRTDENPAARNCKVLAE